MREHSIAVACATSISTAPCRRSSAQPRVKAFQGGDGDLFLISLKAGGTGLNLTAADYVIHLDPGGICRRGSGIRPYPSHRPEPPSHRLSPVVADTIEERIIELHRHKRDLAAKLLEGAKLSARLSEEQLIALIRQ